MGFEKNNQELVEELIEKRWTMDDIEFEKKYESLNLDDKCRVAEVIDNMEEEMMENFGIEEDDEDFALADYCRGGELTED